MMVVMGDDSKHLMAMDGSWSCAGREVGDAVRALCSALAPQALHLTDAFGIPDYVVQAPIALDWQKYNLVDNKGECVDYLKDEFRL